MLTCTEYKSRSDKQKRFIKEIDYLFQFDSEHLHYFRLVNEGQLLLTCNDDEPFSTILSYFLIYSINSNFEIFKKVFFDFGSFFPVHDTVTVCLPLVRLSYVFSNSPSPFPGR